MYSLLHTTFFYSFKPDKKGVAISVAEKIRTDSSLKIEGIIEILKTAVGVFVAFYLGGRKRKK